MAAETRPSFLVDFVDRYQVCWEAWPEYSDVEAQYYGLFWTATHRLVPSEHEDEYSHVPDPVFGSLVMLEKGHRGQVPVLRRI